MSVQTLSLITLSLAIASIVWLTGITFFLLKQQQFFQTFTKDVTKKDLKKVLKNIAVSLKTVGDEINHLHDQIAAMRKADQSHLQKIGFVRYNPFSDTGGDQSFCLCLLDQKDNGFIITSLHSREQTRIYSKSVEVGSPVNHELSKEEKQALQMAMKSAPKRVL